MNEIDNSTKVEMLCELAHNRVLEDSKFDNFGTFIFDEIGDYTERGVELFNVISSITFTVNVAMFYSLRCLLRNGYTRFSIRIIVSSSST